MPDPTEPQPAARPPAGVPSPPDAPPDVLPQVGGPSLKPAAAAAGVATVALAGGIAAVALSSGSSRDDGGASGPIIQTGTGPGTGDTDGSGSGSTATTSPVSGSGTGTVSASAIAGDWTGSIDGGGTPVGMRLTLDGGDPAAVTGRMMFADPDTNAWAPAGTLTGTLDGATLKLESNSDTALTLTVSGDSLTGSGELTRKDNPFPVKVTLTRG